MASSSKFYCWKAFDDWTSSLYPEEITSVEEGSAFEAPNPLNPKAVYIIGPCGWNQGAPRDMPVDPRTRILKVMVRHGKMIGAIRILYQRDDGGSAESSEWWGSARRQSYSEFSLGEEERLTCVSGHYGSLSDGGSPVIRSLKFTTDKGVSYGPYGDEEGTSFKLDAQGGKIVGFFGLSLSFLNAIGIYTTALYPEEITSVEESSALEAPSPMKPQAVYRIGPCGGEGGYDRDMPADPRTLILKVMVRHGKMIGAIRILYQRDDGGPAERSKWWGSGGVQLSEFSLGEEERLTCVSGHYGRLSDGENPVIRSLKFTTDRGVSYGPYGCEEGTSFKLDAQGGKIVGFFGLSLSFLNAIGIYTTALYPEEITSVEESSALEAPSPMKPQAVYRIGPCGGEGGYDRDMPADPRTRILKVNVQHGEFIGSIRILHRRDDGRPAESSKSWGLLRGQSSSEFSLGEEERLTCVSGHYGQDDGEGPVIIRSLKFTTDRGVSYGPYGCEEGTSFKLDAQGGKIVGFFCRSSIYLYSIGIYTKGN